jgi:hypothetical protein
MTTQTKPLPPERMPEPVTRQPKIDGGRLNFDHERPPRKAPTIVQGEFTPENTPSLRRRSLGVLRGGLASGREVEIVPGQEIYTLPIPRSEPAPPAWITKMVAGKEVRQMVLDGGFATATYRRTDRRDADGLPIYDYQGVE